MLSVHEQDALESAFLQPCVGHDALVVGALVIDNVVPPVAPVMKFVGGFNLDDPKARCLGNDLPPVGEGWIDELDCHWCPPS